MLCGAAMTWGKRSRPSTPGCCSRSARLRLVHAGRSPPPRQASVCAGHVTGHRSQQYCAGLHPASQQLAALGSPVCTAHLSGAGLQSKRPGRSGTAAAQVADAVPGHHGPQSARKGPGATAGRQHRHRCAQPLPVQGLPHTGCSEPVLQWPPQVQLPELSPWLLAGWELRHNGKMKSLWKLLAEWLPAGNPDSNKVRPGCPCQSNGELDGLEQPSLGLSRRLAQHPAPAAAKSP